MLLQNSFIAKDLQYVVKNITKAVEKTTRQKRLAPNDDRRFHNNEIINVNSEHPRTPWLIISTNKQIL